MCCKLFGIKFVGYYLRNIDFNTASVNILVSFFNYEHYRLFKKEDKKFKEAKLKFIKAHYRLMDVFSKLGVSKKFRTSLF